MRGFWTSAVTVGVFQMRRHTCPPRSDLPGSFTVSLLLWHGGVSPLLFYPATWIIYRDAAGPMNYGEDCWRKDFVTVRKEVCEVQQLFSEETTMRYLVPLSVCSTNAENGYMSRNWLKSVWRVPNQTNNCILITRVVFVPRAWYLLLLCAIELLHCPKPHGWAMLLCWLTGPFITLNTNGSLLLDSVIFWIECLRCFEILIRGIRL